MYVVSSNELLFQVFSEFLMDLDCLSQDVSISRLQNFQKSANICVFCKYYYFSLCKHWPSSGVAQKLFDTFSDKQSKILKIFEIKVHLMR